MNLTRLTLAALVVLALVAGCNDQPSEGQACAAPGSIYVHGNVRLICTDEGIWSK